MAVFCASFFLGAFFVIVRGAIDKGVRMSERLSCSQHPVLHNYKVQTVKKRHLDASGKQGEWNALAMLGSRRQYQRKTYPSW